MSANLESQEVQSRYTVWRGTLALIFTQMANNLRSIPQAAFFLIYLQEQFGLAPVVISSVFSAALIAGTLAALIGGSLTARLGSKWALLWGIILSGMSSLVFNVDLFWLVVLLWLIGGIGGSLVNVSGSSYLTRLGTRGTLGVISGVYALSMTIGGAIGNPIAGLLIEQYGFNTFGWAGSALTVATVLIAALWMANLHDYAAEPVPLRMFGVHLLPSIRRPRVLQLIGLRGLPTLFYGTLTMLIPLLINELSGNKVTVATYGTAMLVVASAAQLLAGKATDRWGARPPTLVAYMILIASGIGLFFGAGSVEGLFVFGILGNAAAWALSTLMYSWVADGIPSVDHPSTFGTLHAVWNLCMIGGSMLGGWLVRLAPGVPFLVLGLLNIGACFLVIRYYRHETS